MDVFDLQAKIDLDIENFKKGIRQASENFDKISNKVSSTSESIEKINIPMSKFKSDVMKLADEYKKSGIDASEAMKKAHSDIKKSYEEQGIVVEKANKKISDSNEEVSESAENESEKVKKSHKKINDSQKSTSEESEKSSKTFVSNWEKAASSIEQMSERIKSALATLTKISAAAVGAASTGLGIILKESVNSYASYEQLIGGVETLFETSADKVQAYADAAYKTAGMSANEYMETVTSFSASLLQGLGGDTDKAADIANQAIIDMSDNANKMGTDMESIQNAYQGFAKGNYTMLDNLNNIGALAA